MEEEEEKSIFRLKVCSDFAGLDNGTCIVNKKDVKIVLNLIKKQDKQIDLMARAWKQDDIRSIEEIKEEFKKKAEEENERI